MGKSRTRIVSLTRQIEGGQCELINLGLFHLVRSRKTQLGAKISQDGRGLRKREGAIDIKDRGCKVLALWGEM